MADKRVRSGKYTGVYLLKQNNSDISYSILYKNSEGKNQRETIGLKSEGISELYAYNKRIDRINQVKHGEDPRAKKQNKNKVRFQDVWNFYIDNKALSENVKKDYKGRWDKHMRQDFSETITMEKLISFRKRLRKLKKPLSERSIDMMVGMMGSALRYWNSQPINHSKIHDVVSDLRVYDRDHVTKKEKKKRTIKRDRYLETDEIHMLNIYNQDKHPDLMLFVKIALSTGARLGSIMLIKKKDISGNKIILLDEKDGNDRYTAYLNKDTLALIKPIFSEMKPNDKIFTLTKSSLQKRLQRILNQLFNQGLDTKDRENRVVLHTLRHTFASHLVMNGTPLTIVQKLLNHSELETTSRYAHLSPDAGKDAVLSLWNT